MKESAVSQTTKKSELAEESNFDFTVEARDLLQDLKMLMRDVYLATYKSSGKALKLCFNNGQIFVISVTEIK